MKSRITDFGFEYGAASIERLCSHERKGWVFIGVSTARDYRIEISVTKTGKMRVFRTDKDGNSKALR